MSLMVINEDHYVPSVVYGAGSYTLHEGEDRHALHGRCGPHAGRSGRPEGRRSRSTRLQDAIKVSQKSAGKFEVPDWDQASQKKVRDALLVLATTMPDFKKAFGTKDEVDPVRHLIGTRRGLGRQSRQGRDLSQRHAGQERRHDRLQAQCQGRAGRRLLVGQPLQRRRLLREEPVQCLFDQQHHRARKAPTARSPSSSAAATARFRTACRS